MNVFKFFLKDMFVGAEQMVIGRWLQRKGAAQENGQKSWEICLKQGKTKNDLNNNNNNIVITVIAIIMTILRIIITII